MKITIWIVFFFTIFVTLLNSCTKNCDPQIKNNAEGKAFALLNGIEWNSNAHTLFNPKNKVSIGLTYYNERNLRRNGFNFRNVPLSVGTFFPVNYGIAGSDSLLTVSFYTYLDGGDVIGDAYEMFGDSTVQLSIDSINESGEIIVGTFSAKLAKYLLFGQERDPLSPDTLIFEHGTFVAKVEK